MRFGKREAGRDGVHTLKAEDDRIKWVAFPSVKYFIN